MTQLMIQLYICIEIESHHIKRKFSNNTYGITIFQKENNTIIEIA